MNLVVYKTPSLQGQVTPPSSKSQTIRGLIIALLATGESTLTHVLDSEDANDAIQICEHLGAHITQVGDQLKIRSTGFPIQHHPHALYSGNSGITTRFILPILGLRKTPTQPIVLNCGEQMRARPIHSLVNALTDLGLTIHYTEQEGTLPISISGTLRGGIAEVAGITSQYISALLMALPCAEQDSQITVNNLHERPYMEMTLNWLNIQNIHYTHERHPHYDIFHIQGRQHYTPFNLRIAGDFSSASYLIAAAALLPGRVEITGLDMQDPQGDKRLIPLLQEMGADISMTPQSLIIQGGKVLTGIHIDANDIPDLLPTLAVIGTCAQGKTEIYNVKQARIKETDRIHSMTEGLTRLGATVEEYEDAMTVYQSELQGALVQGYGDHRTVMALSIAGLFATGKTIITDGSAINKTFPTFIQLMQSLGATMEMENEAAD